MSTTIDQRVVEMQFDNKHFESNVSTTMSTLDKLKQKLHLDGATKGLENVNHAAKNVNMSALGSAVETVQAKFSAMQVIGVTALANITNSAVNAGKRMVSALTIDPVKTGFSEYETQINAVQTILANTESKGTTLGQVNSALDELNTYADKTIYNFTEMTRNIGTFTAAGVDLDTSVNAIQGIANLAAVSGSSSQQASTAMYQLSQALASGTVKLMDWNSVVNAGMGGQVFQDALKETARVHGIAIDDMITSEGSFRETLKDGWLTSEILTETLSHFTMAAEKGSEQWNKYKKSLMDDGYSAEQAEAILKLSNTATDAATKVKTATQLWDTLKETAQSGWTQTWEIILGDFEEAKELFSGIYETLSPMLEATAKARNELLGGALSSNWDKMITKINEAGIETTEFEERLRATAESHGIDVDAMIEDHGSLEKAFRSGAISADVLKEAVADLEGNLVDLQSIERELARGDAGEDVKTIQSALSKLDYDIGDAGIDGKLGPATERAIKAFQEANGLKVTGIVDEETLTALDKATGKVEGLSDSVSGLISDITQLGGRELLIDSLKNVFEGLMSVVKPIKEAFREIFPPTTADQLYSLIESFNKFTKKLTLGKTASNNLKRTFKGLFAVLDIVKQAIGAVFKAIGPLFGRVDDLGGGILGATAKLGDWLVGLNESIKTSGFFENAVEKIHAAFEKVKSVLEKVGNFLEPVTEGVKQFGNEITKSVTKISSDATERLGPLGMLAKFIKNVFIGIGRAIKKVFPYISSAATGIGNIISDLMGRITESIQNADYDTFFDLISGGIITAIGVFITKFMKNAGGFLDNIKDAGGFLDNIKDILGGVSDALGAFTDSLKADTLKKIATAIAILAVSLLVLALIPSEKLTTALLSITTLFGELMGSMAIFSKMGDTKGLSKIATAMVGLAVSIFILSLALKIMSTLSWEELGVGLTALTVGLGALVGAVNLLPEKKVNGAAKAIKKMSVAILILAVAIKIMSTMSWEEMGIGLISMVVGLGALVGAVNLLPKDTARRAAGLIGLATAMVILGAALKIMATMSWDDIARSLVTLGGSLIILAVAMKFMKKALPGAAAMMIVAPALVVLAGALRLMADMSWDEIFRGLVVLGGSLIIISAAMALMRKALPGAAALLVVTAALAVLAPVLKILGSMSFDEIGRSLLMLVGVFVIFGLAGLILKPLVGTLIALSASLVLVGVACVAIGTGVLLCGVGLSVLAAAIATSGAAITIFVSSLISLIPYLIEQVGVGIIKLCEVIAGSADAICDAATVIITALVDAIVASVPALVEGALVLVEELLNSLVAHMPTIVSTLCDFLIAIMDAIAEKLPDLIKAGADLIMALFSGIIEALQDIDTSTLIDGILAIGLITGLMYALSSVAALTPSAMLGVLGVGAVIAELSLVIAAIGGLAQIPGLEWLISEGGDFLQTVGTAIGQFIGGIVGGIGEGISDSLPTIGTNLSTFMTNLQPFIDGVKLLDSNVIEGVGSLAGIILTLTAASLLDGIASWLRGGTSIADFGDDLVLFAEDLVAFATAAEGVDSDAVAIAANAGSMLAAMAGNIPNSGGVLGFIMGENDIDKFGQMLPVFGKGLADFSESVAGKVDEDAVAVAANAGSMLAAMAGDIPNSGGVLGFIMGENDIDKFGEKLPVFGQGITDFCDAIGDNVTTDKAEAAAAAAEVLIGLSKQLPNTGGVLGWLQGDQDLSHFGSQLKDFGKGIAGFAEAVEGIDPATTESAAIAGKTLAEMAGGLAAATVLASMNGVNFDAFGTSMASYGSAMKTFSTACKGIVLGDIWLGRDASDAITSMTDPSTIVASITAFTDSAAFKTNLYNFGWALATYTTAAKAMDTVAITDSASAIKSLVDANIPSLINNFGTYSNSIYWFNYNLESLVKALKKYGDDIKTVDVAGMKANTAEVSNAVKAISKMVDTDTTNIKTFSKSLGDFGASGVDAFINSFAGASSKVYNAGADMVAKFLNGAKSKNESLKTAFEAIASACASALDNRTAFYNAGSNLVSSFASGISENDYKAEAKARAMAKAAVEAAKDELDINSPSKVFRKIGTSVPEGFAMGIDKLSSMVTDSSRSMGQVAIDNVQSTIRRLAESVNTDIDSQPTIRPVLDLTNVRAGAGSISSLLNTGSSVGVIADVGRVSAMMNGYSQNGVNAEVVSAINKLRKDMGNVGNTTYSINGISVSEGTDAAEAIHALVRTIKMEGRT